MSLDKESIDKEVGILGIEAHMFWELPKVREMFNELCKRWFYSDNKAYTHSVIDVSEDPPVSTETKTTNTLSSNVIVGSEKEKRQCVKLGFVDKLIELWKLRKRILEDKTEITVSGILSRYNHDAGKAMMNKTVNFISNYISQLFKTRNKALTMEEKSELQFQCTIMKLFYIKLFFYNVKRIST